MMTFWVNFPFKYNIISNLTKYKLHICDPVCESPAKVFFLDLLFYIINHVKSM